MGMFREDYFSHRANLKVFHLLPASVSITRHSLLGLAAQSLTFITHIIFKAFGT